MPTRAVWLSTYTTSNLHDMINPNLNVGILSLRLPIDRKLFLDNIARSKFKSLLLSQVPAAPVLGCLPWGDLTRHRKQDLRHKASSIHERLQCKGDNSWESDQTSWRRWVCQFQFWETILPRSEWIWTSWNHITLQECN